MKKALGLAIGSKDKAGSWLEFFFSDIFFNIPDQLTDELNTVFKNNQLLSGDNIQKIFDIKNLLTKHGLVFKKHFFDNFPVLPNNPPDNKRFFVVIWTDIDTSPLSVADAYLKLHLISRRDFKPNQLNLTGLFDILPNIAWTNQGPFNIKDLDYAMWQARTLGKQLWVRSLDKFPPLTDYLVPSKVRIADTARVRLGAYLGSGTTVMHEGFINFNAGTQGPNMVEGRISAGVWVEENSDLGGGSSTMGTLSGGGEVLVSVGKNCLIGANAGLGIALGDNCTIESGLYLTSGSKVAVLDKKSNKPEKIVKARQLSYVNDLLFRRNSLTGGIECLAKRNLSTLNEQLHTNQ